MDNKQIDGLLDKLATGSFTSEEEQQVRAFIHRYRAEGDSGLTAQDFTLAETQMWDVIAQSSRPKVSRLPVWRIAVAAAVATIIFGAGLFYFYNQPAKTQQSAAYANDVAPGKQGATLTLANGRKILIGDVAAGDVASQSGVKISKTADGKIIYKLIENNAGKLEYNTLSTAKGEQMQLRLPDGSVVFLNAASSLKYPVSFAKLDKRTVSLTGEGYFEIAKDKAHPFMVITGSQQVQVLGTHFNINAYPDEPAVATTLLEGSVKISSSQGTKEVAETVLKPGQQSLNTGGRIDVANVDVEGVTDWKDGDFYLDRENFRTAMRKISRWYDVEVIYDAALPDDIESSGYISKSNQLSAVLKAIEKSGQVHFKIEGRRIYVFK